MAIFKYNQGLPSQEDPHLYLQYWGRENCEPGHAVGPGIREMFKIHFIHQGKGIVRVGENEFMLSAGQAFLIYPHHITYYEADSLDPWTYSWIGFNGTEVLPALNRTRLSPDQPVFPMDLKIMPDLYEQLTEAATHERSGDLRLQSILYAFLSVLVESFPPLSSSEGETSSSRKQDVYVHQSLAFLNAHYSDDISVQQLADYLGLERKYLSAIFKEMLGIPPQQYLLNYRMDKACSLLEKGQYTIGEVARSVGYQDALLFSRMFKKVKGVSPKHFK